MHSPAGVAWPAGKPPARGLRRSQHPEGIRGLWQSPSRLEPLLHSGERFGRCGEFRPAFAAARSRSRWPGESARTQTRADERARAQPAYAADTPKRWHPRKPGTPRVFESLKDGLGRESVPESVRRQPLTRGVGEHCSQRNEAGRLVDRRGLAQSLADDIEAAGQRGVAEGVGPLPGPIGANPGGERFLRVRELRLGLGKRCGKGRHWTRAWPLSVSRRSKLIAPDLDRRPRTPMPERLLGILGDQALQLGLRSFVGDVGFPGRPIEGGEFGPRVRAAHVNGPDRLDAGPRRLDPG
jgi:hypothetical protein